MKKNPMAIKDNIMILFILLISFTYNLSKNIINFNPKSKEILNIERKKNYLVIGQIQKINKNNRAYNDRSPFVPGDDFHDYNYNKEEEQPRQKRNNVTQETFYESYDEEIKSLNAEISKYKIYIIFLSILASILFLIIVIYSSIKCFILCTKKDIPEYRVSDISTNRLGEVYFDENGEERISEMNLKNIDDCADAPIYANNKSKNAQINTFNPDNCMYSSQDKKLYKPYSNEDIQ